MGSSLGRGLAEQRESWQAAGGRRPRAKSTVLPASAALRGAMPDEGPGGTILLLCHQPCGGMLRGWRQGWAGLAGGPFPASGAQRGGVSGPTREAAPPAPQARTGSHVGSAAAAVSACLCI